MTKEGRNASLVRAGAEAVGNWRGANPTQIIEAERVAVTDLDLSGANLSAANLRCGTFIRCNLRHVSFADANLERVKFDDCALEDADFRGANLKAATIIAKNLGGARFERNHTLGRLAMLQIIDPVARPILFDHSSLPWYDRFLGWDRLRFLATIRIFIPAYASLTLTVIYLNGLAWYNSAVTFLSSQSRGIELPILTQIAPTWTHALTLINFLVLSVAATSFLGCPARVVEFSRERWMYELQQPELLYEHSTSQRLFVRMLCASSITLGGLMSIYLLGRGIIQQIIFITGNLG